MAAPRSSRLTRIDKRKKLDALFDRGGYVRLNSDSQGRPIVDPEVESPNDVLVWVGPPSPLQREMAIRDAQASRARAVLQARNDESSDTWATIRAFIASMSKEELIEFIIDLNETDYIAQARRDVLVEKQWEDFNQLRDAMRNYEDAGSPAGDPEWEPLLERNRDFADQVLARADVLEGDARGGYKFMPRANLEEKAVDLRIEQAASSAFMVAYEENMLFYSCRDDEDHKALYFDSVDDMKSQPQEMQDGLARKLASFITDAGEAKNLQGVVPGSTSSEPPASPETSESSTPEG
jgi:hypothetical protein